MTTGLSEIRMDLEELRVLLAVSPMLDHNKMAVRRVLVDGWAVTAAAEKLGVSPSTVHRACEAVLRKRAPAGELIGPAGAFEAWYKARCVVTPPVKSSRGVMVPLWSDGSALRKDLAKFEPMQPVSKVVFGRLMELKGHKGELLNGRMRYPGVGLVDEPATTLGQFGKPVDPPGTYRGRPLRRPDGGRWVDPETGKEISDRHIRAYFDSMDETMAYGHVIDPRTGIAIGTRIALGMVSGKATKGGSL